MTSKLALDSLNEISRQSGFSLCGVTDLSPLAEFNFFQGWLDAGLNGAMEYLRNDQAVQTRANPILFMPEARSIIVVGARYSSGHTDKRPSGLVGEIAGFARGLDYHHILTSRAERMLAEINRTSNNSSQGRIAVDSQPLLEKPLAHRAGLGWQGRHSLLINPRQGSFFNLAEIFTTLEFDAGSPELPERCGTCRKCVDACPTGCIRSDRTIDARRCLSFLTIENKGAIPRELRPALGHRLFGCDTCQAACPWNHRVDDSDVLPEYRPRDLIDAYPDLRQLVHLSPVEIKNRFGASPLLRARRRGLLRNAAIALGNYHSEDALDPLEHLLRQEPDAMIRSHAAWGLGQIPTPRAREILSACSKSEPQETVRQEIRLALENN